MLTDSTYRYSARTQVFRVGDSQGRNSPSKKRSPKVNIGWELQALCIAFCHLLNAFNPISNPDSTFSLSITNIARPPDACHGPASLSFYARHSHSFGMVSYTETTGFGNQFKAANSHTIILRAYWRYLSCWKFECYTDPGRHFTCILNLRMAISLKPTMRV